MNNSSLVSFVDRKLRPLGYAHKRTSWYNESSDSVAVINLQKSQWGGQFYVNLGVYFLTLGSDRFPAEHKCHLRLRLSPLSDSRLSALDDALNLEQAHLTDAERERILGEALTQVAVPWLQERRRVPDIVLLDRADELSSVVVAASLRQLLDRSA